MTRKTLQVPELMERLEYGPAPDGSSEVRQWLQERGPIGHFIGGRWVEPAAGERFDVHDPSRGVVLAQVAQGSDDDVAAAVAAARECVASRADLRPEQLQPGLTELP